MIATEKLEEILAKCRIIKEFATLPEPVLGYYYCDGNYYIILVNESIRNNECLYRCVLAEEIGHYRMTIGDITPRKYMCYRDRLTMDKQEQEAIRWAINFVIPTTELIDLLKRTKHPDIKDLEDYFFVTHEFLMQKFYFMSKQNCIWDIDGKRSLYLYRYPSVHIFEKI